MQILMAGPSQICWHGDAGGMTEAEFSAVLRHVFPTVKPHLLDLTTFRRNGSNFDQRSAMPAASLAEFARSNPG